MSDSKCSVKAVVLDDGAASLRRADGADIRHAEGVAGVVAAEVLDRGDTQTVKTFRSVGPLTSLSSFSVDLASEVLLGNLFYHDPYFTKNLSMGSLAFQLSIPLSLCPSPQSDYVLSEKNM